MADCFISYKREDRERVASIAGLLREAGLSVWWDADLPGGAAWRESIVAELDAARCVIVCWTEGAVGPAGAYVREEAERAKHRGVLLPVLLDRVAPPFGFGEVQALDLMGWNGAAGAPAWQAVREAVQGILEGRRSRTPAVIHRRRWPWLGGAVTVALAGIGFIADVAGLQAAVCGSDRLGGVCTAIGMGPDDDERKAWAAARQSEQPDGLKAYLASYAKGAFAAEAQARLAACRDVPEVSWVSTKQDSTLVVAKGPATPAHTEAEARQAVQPDVQRDAADACGALPVSELYRPQAGTEPVVPESGWRCSEAAGGWRCGYDGKISCALEARRTVEKTVCPVG